MKKIILVCSVICFLVACNGSSKKSSSPLMAVTLAPNGAVVTTGKKIYGVAAVGAYMPKGSIVEMRGDAVEDPGMNPAPSDILTTTVIDDNGNYIINTGNLRQCYLIRVQDANSGVWYYSTANDSQLSGEATPVLDEDGNPVLDEDGNPVVEYKLTANVNPYTDMIIRQYYDRDGLFGVGASDAIKIDDLWYSGRFARGDTVNGLTYPFHTPNAPSIKYTGEVLTRIIANKYGLNIEDTFTSKWIMGQRLDALIDSVGIANLKAYLTNQVKPIFSYPTFLYDAKLSKINGGNTLRFEMWTNSNPNQYIYGLHIRVVSASGRSTPVQMSYTVVAPYTYYYIIDLPGDPADNTQYVQISTTSEFIFCNIIYSIY